MFRSIISLVVTLLFSFSVLASPSSGVKEVFDEYIYTMEVEGGLVDEAIAQKAQEKFKTELEKLMASGLSRKELLQESFRMVKSDSLRRELEELLSQLEEGSLSEDRFLDQLDRSLSGAYVRGANWNDDTLRVIFGPIILIAIVWGIYKIYMGTTQCLRKNATPAPEENPKCQAYYDKYGYPDDGY